MENLSELFKLLSDETRIRILKLLTQKSLCVCEMVEILDIHQPKISKHIARIKSERLVHALRNEQYTYYSLNKEYKHYDLLLKILDEGEYKKDIEKLNSITSFICER